MRNPAQLARDGGTTITDRCYCGATTILGLGSPQTVAYCHCADCRKVSGAPVAVFVAFAEDEVEFTPDIGRRAVSPDGVTRTFCGTCGSPLSGRYDYLPGQIYIPIGLLDQADAFTPEMHAHEGERLRWLHIADDLPRLSRSARTVLADTDR